MRLAKTNKKPNQNLAGDWIIFWASREGCQKPRLLRLQKEMPRGVDKLFGTGMTDEGWWLQLQDDFVCCESLCESLCEEYLLRLSSKKQGGTSFGVLFHFFFLGFN